MKRSGPSHRSLMPTAATPGHPNPRADVRYGTAGWDYKDWAGVVYPKPAPRGFDPLGYLSKFFDVVEVNSTFYRPAPAAYAVSWADRVAANPRFRFAVKLWRR